MSNTVRNYLVQIKREEERLERVKSLAESLSCDENIFVSNWLDYTPRSRVPLWNAVCLSVGIDPSHKYRGERWIRDVAPHTTGDISRVLKELLVRYEDAMHDVLKPGGDIQTVGKAHEIMLLDFLRWATAIPWELPDEFPGKPKPTVSASKLQTVPLEEATANEHLRPATARPLTFKKNALIKQYEHIWPTVKQDINDGARSGLSAAAKAGARGWREAEALEWARTNGRLQNTEKCVDRLKKVMHKMSDVPSHRHRQKG